MLGRLFGSNEPRLVPMKQDHLSQVVAIIAETDEDDATEAEENLISGGGEGMFVLLVDRKVAGVTGALPVDGVEDVAWLSWTYLGAVHRGKGLGKFMIDKLLGTLSEHEIRKIFIATSDCVEDGMPIYAAAHRLYQEMGAVEELRLPGYHAEDEAMIVFGLVNPAFDAPDPAPEDPPVGLMFDSAERAPDSDRIAALHWRELEPGEAGAPVQGLAERMAEVRAGKARGAVVALPRPLSDIAAEALQVKGFVRVGNLAEYYAAGVDQIWWSVME